ncbi:MAG TPA: winged helix-turn-helix domain-containing protein [Gaiellaceae bacterium]|nr:winged helix-turn-helix domain-containing protein [Gaiellaceae bacterium]
MIQKASVDTPSASKPTWFVLTNHGNVLLCVARDPTIRISEIARSVGIGERAAQKILADLVSGGFLVRIKEGRRNRYEINRNAHLRHPLFAELEIGPLLDVLRDGHE